MHVAVQRVSAAGLLALLVLPLLFSLVLAIGEVWSFTPWLTWLSDGRLSGAAWRTLWTGIGSAVLAWLAMRAILVRLFFSTAPDHDLRVLPWMLAVPHVSFAIGVLLLLSPSGWILRWFSPWATGLSLPPAWVTTQDPWGISLILALALKEAPFLLWMAASHWLRDDVRRQWRTEHAVAMSLGYGPGQAWKNTVWPQLRRRLLWPMAAVLAYSLTVVDVAIVIGPSAPPTLAVLIWEWLSDADPTVNRQGTAAAIALAALVALVVSGWWVWLRGQRPSLSGRRNSEPARSAKPAPLSVAGLTAIYGLVLAMLLLQSLAGWWPFPDVWPRQWTLHAWRSVWSSRDVLVSTLGFAVAATSVALLWSLAWLELAPKGWDRRWRPIIYLPLALPALTWVVGLYGLVLRWQLEGHWLAVLVGHVLVTTPYVLLALSPAYQAYDPRYRALTASLGHSPWTHAWRVKWPTLRRAMAAAGAVGFAVSVSQYLPTLYLGAGRHASVTTEAVALAAGGQRSLAGAYAWLQLLLPVMAFSVATWIGRPRQFKVRA